MDELDCGSMIDVTFAIDNLLDFGSDEIPCAAAMQPSSADESSVTADSDLVPIPFGGFEWLSNFYEDSTTANKDAMVQSECGDVSGVLIPGTSRSGEAVLLGSVREEEERANGIIGSGAGGGCYHQFNMQHAPFSPVSVLESCATSSAGGGGSNGSVMSNNTKNTLVVQQQPPATRTSKRGRPLLSSRRARSTSSASSYDMEESSDNECVPTESEVSEEEEDDDEEEEEGLEEEEDLDDEEEDDEVEQQSRRRRIKRPKLPKPQQFKLHQQQQQQPRSLLSPPLPHSGPRTVHVSRPPPQKKHRISGAAAATAAAAAAAAATGQRCSHCQTQRTPQWRAGPKGPKTLCNACGVRYKSGRLLPEYRPAGSPTFAPERHSNSHRKVLEMRKRGSMAETTTTVAVALAPAPAFTAAASTAAVLEAAAAVAAGAALERDVHGAATGSQGLG